MAAFELLRIRDCLKNIYLEQVFRIHGKKKERKILTTKARPEFGEFTPNRTICGEFIQFCIIISRNLPIDSTEHAVRDSYLSTTSAPFSF